MNAIPGVTKLADSDNLSSKQCKYQYGMCDVRSNIPGGGMDQQRLHLQDDEDGHAVAEIYCTGGPDILS